MSKNFYQMIKDGLVVDGGGGAPAPVLIEKSITANGDYYASAESADGYSAVSVAVPNTYSAGDEGKVVSNGALVTQREQLLTPLFLPGEFHAQRSLADYSPWGHKQLDTTERLSLHLITVVRITRKKLKASEWKRKRF